MEAASIIYGVFESAGSYAPFTDGYSLELQKRIFKPLHMENAIAELPDSRKDTLFKHIDTPCIYDTLKHAFKEDTVNYCWTQAFSRRPAFYLPLETWPSTPAGTKITN